MVNITSTQGFLNAQLPFWNRYYHSHVVMWLGLAFPDGAIVLDRDPMAWPTSTTQAEMLLINAQRVLLGQPEFRLYSDKIFRTDQILIAAYSAARGFVTPWMHNLNHIMSPLRVSVEWSYGKVKYLFQSLSLKMAQKMLRGRPVDDFICATFFTNCRTCYYQCVTNGMGLFVQARFGVFHPRLQIHVYLGQ